MQKIIIVLSLALFSVPVAAHHSPLEYVAAPPWGVVLAGLFLAGVTLRLKHKAASKKIDVKDEVQDL